MAARRWWLSAIHGSLALVVDLCAVVSLLCAVVRGERSAHLIEERAAARIPDLDVAIERGCEEVRLLHPQRHQMGRVPGVDGHLQLPSLLALETPHVHLWYKKIHKEWE